MKILFKTIVGSKLYGLDTPESDTDYRGFGMPDVSAIIGLRRQEQDETKSLEENSEGTIFSLNKYIHLLMKGNPTVFELAFANEKFHVESTPEGLEICAFVKKHFVTKHLFKPYSAYFRAQQRELNNTKRIGKRLELVKKYGYDCKYASHAARLAYQCCELMRTGTLNPTLEGAEREICMGIKTGAYSLSKVNDLLSILDKDMYYEYEKSLLPTHPDFKSVENFVITKYYDYLKENLDVRAN